MKQLRIVNRSLVGLKRQLRAAVKELNEKAAVLVTRGQYESSAALIDLAKGVSDFGSEVEALRQRWATLKRGGGSGGGGEKTPLWEYYILVAKALVELGEDVGRSEVIDWIDRSAVDQLKPGDLGRTTQGKLIWQRNIGRARRAMIKEGYLEPNSGSRWKLTRLGREIVKRQNDKS